MALLRFIRKFSSRAYNVAARTEVRSANTAFEKMLSHSVRESLEFAALRRVRSPISSASSVLSNDLVVDGIFHRGLTESNIWSGGKGRRKTKGDWGRDFDFEEWLLSDPSDHYLLLSTMSL